MTSYALSEIVDSLAAGAIGIDDFMQAVEDHTDDLHSDNIRDES